jgi:hypothetical protein
MDGPQNPSAGPTPSLDQYKAYLADLGNIGTRYTTANGFHLSVVTALLGILALTKGTEPLARTGAYLELVVASFAVLVCMVWSRSIASYSHLFAIKFAVLREMEQKGNLFPIFERENELRGKLAVLQNDRYIPRLLAAPFLVALVLISYRVIR